MNNKNKMEVRSKLLFGVLSLILVIAAVLIVDTRSSEEVIIYSNDTKNELISIYISDEEGNYVVSESNDFPTDGYTFNEEKSYCVNESVLDYDSSSYKMNVTTRGSDNCYVYFDGIVIDAITYEFTGDVQEFVVPATGTYQIKLWGASPLSSEDSNFPYGNAYGAFVSGNIQLEKGDILYLYLSSNSKDTSFNVGTTRYSVKAGATDVRLVSGSWSDTTSVNSRIMVAGAGSGSGGLNSWNSGTPYGGSAGGLTGYTGGNMNNGSGGIGGTQTSGGAFNVASGQFSGGGYYSGVDGYCSNGVAGSGGGSSFISGHTGAVAITSESNSAALTGCTTGTNDYSCSVHYSGKVFTDTVMIDGLGYSWTNVIGEQEQMPNPEGGFYELGIGHSGEGYAIINYIRS